MRKGTPVFTNGDRDGLCKSLILRARLDLLHKSPLLADHWVHWVPSRFVSQLHPHFHEVMQVLALQAADEALHIEVFTRRALLKRKSWGPPHPEARRRSRRWLKSLAIASFLLSVLGEGTFLSLLWFLDQHAADPVTAAVCRLSAQDEALHVAFGVAQPPLIH